MYKKVNELIDPSLIKTQKNIVNLPTFFGRYQDIIHTSLCMALKVNQSDQLQTIIRYHLGEVDTNGNPVQSSKGKALRPVMCLLACQSLGGLIDHALPAATALELIHNFSLIHDDIQDGDKERHGRPTVWSIWGRNKGLISGNAMRVLADTTLWEMINQGVGYSKSLSASRLLLESYIEMIDGQYLDMTFEDSLDIKLPDYILLISLKTGALIRCAMELGAFMASDDKILLRAFRKSGQLFGASFQIRDDYLGIWGDQTITGKSVGSDIFRKKKSFPVVYTFDEAKGKDKALLDKIYSKKILTYGDVETVLKIMERVGAKEYSDNMAYSKCKEAMKALPVTNISRQGWKEFKELGDFFISRSY